MRTVATDASPMEQIERDIRQLMRDAGRNKGAIESRAPVITSPAGDATLTCPVCDWSITGEQTCPACGTDLAPLWRIKRLPRSTPWYGSMASFLAGAFLVWSITYVRSTAPPAPRNEEPRAEVIYVQPPVPVHRYQIRRGDTLRRISTRKYGSPAYAKDIEQLNRDQIKQRGGLVPGDTILLPSITLSPRE